MQIPNTVRNYLLIFLFLTFGAGSLLAQDSFNLTVKGIVKKDSMPVKGAIISLSGDPKNKTKPQKTKKDGSFNVELNFGVKGQVIKFEYPGCATKYMEVNTILPAAKQKVFYTYEINPEFKDTSDKASKKYKYPIIKVFYKDGVFMDDLKYRELFEKGQLEELEDYHNPNKKKKKTQQIPTEKPKTISARFTVGESDKPLTATKVTLLNDSGEIIQTYVTNAVGRFIFKNIPADKNYLVHIEESDVPLSAKVNMVGKGDKVIQTASAGPDKKFSFKILAKDKGIMNLLEYDDTHFKIAGNLMGGAPVKPLANVRLILLNELGIAEQQTNTNLFGAFVFSGVSKDQKFTIKVDEEAKNVPVNAKILISNKDGKEVVSTTSDGKGMFKYEFLPTDKNTLALIEVDDSELRLDLNGKVLQGGKSAVPVNKAKVNLLDHLGSLIQTSTTDKAGKFKIRNVPADGDYTISIDEKESKIAPNSSIVIADEKGKAVKEHKADKNKKFNFHLRGSDKNQLGYYYMNDAWAQLLNGSSKDTVLISERMYYAVNDAGISNESKSIMDKVIQVMLAVPELSIELHSYTDAKGDADSNMKLSQKRAKNAVDYIIAGGVDAKRITGIGNGETKLVNNCGHDSNCSEEEHAKNRRIEFVVIRK